jgi:hypothetical protein
MAMVRTVRGTPTFRYSVKEIFTVRLARSTMIRLATGIVRFPARVEDMASVSQPWTGSVRWLVKGFKRSTAGTLLTTFDRMAVRGVRHAYLIEAKMGRERGKIVGEECLVHARDYDEKPHEHHE